jgi:hypothetical protein
MLKTKTKPRVEKWRQLPPQRRRPRPAARDERRRLEIAMNILKLVARDLKKMK